jgi:phytoene dehydrogenase-like protein
MYRLAEALLRLACELGVDVQTSTPVSRVLLRNG